MKKKIEAEKKKQAAMKKKIEAEKKKQAAMKKIIDSEKKKIAAQKRKIAAQKKKMDIERKKREEKIASVKRAKIRQENLKRQISDAGISKKLLNSDEKKALFEYGEKIKTKVKKNTTFLFINEIKNNPKVEFSIKILSNGSIENITLTKSSGYKNFDNAVKKSILKSTPFPPPPEGVTMIKLTQTPKNN